MACIDSGPPLSRGWREEKRGVTGGKVEGDERRSGGGDQRKNIKPKKYKGFRGWPSWESVAELKRGRVGYIKNQIAKTKNATIN